LTTLKKFQRYGEEIEKLLQLKTSPVAVKMLTGEEEIPPGAVRPKRDRGYHLAQCQAFALARRDKMTIAMLKEDHWCPAALIAYGMVPRPTPPRGHPYHSFKEGRYIGVLTAPLNTAAFRPDVVIIYANTSQLRSLMLALPLEEGLAVKSHFFPPSCAYAVVHVMQDRAPWIVLPDPGEFQRALGTEDEMMFSLPANKMDSFMASLREGQGKGFRYRGHHMLLRPDFPHPDFYKEMFRRWGLEVKEDKL
jgi:uncharacterized protein (DUF169 family)